MLVNNSQLWHVYRVIIHYDNMPTRSRFAKGDIAINEKRAYAENPLRIDKLYNRQVISLEHHTAGLRFYQLWMHAGNRNKSIMNPDTLSMPIARDLSESSILNRLTCKDLYVKLIRLLHDDDYKILHHVICDEMPLIPAAKEINISKKYAAPVLRNAFESLIGAFKSLDKIQKDFNACN